ncbi:MAG: hypothetical protein A2Z25_11845 [Planctomycetes bacterium RBG_16_55_9]|nr:MAG: hypothetical protein A2Z25_11845 [Planctomycetes bacterium RBG_16_55_9]
MQVTLDGQRLFDEQPLEIRAGSFRRDSMERTVPGLDGVLSIDLGRRNRQVTQTGTLRAESRLQMDAKISTISAHIDGLTHTLIAGSREFDNLRMDSFKILKEYKDGVGIRVDYEITYTQLA